MSMPSLSTSGGIFLLYPAIRAAKVLDRQDKLYIVSMLNRVAPDVPVAGPLAMHILEFENDFPQLEHCQSPFAKKIWDMNGDYVGN